MHGEATRIAGESMNEAAYRAILRRLGVEPSVREAPPSEEVARLLSMPLPRFAQEGCLLEVRVPWLEVTLWFVPGQADAEALLRDGVAHRGQIWTARELEDLLSVPGLTPEHAQTLAFAKLEFSGTVVEVRHRA